MDYRRIDDWLDKAPPPDSPEYATMQEEQVSKVAVGGLRFIAMPQRHGLQEINRANVQWNAAFEKVGKRLVQSEDTMLALLGPRGTGKTQMSMELIRFMARHKAELVVKPARMLERWAWFGRVCLSTNFASYSNTMDFFLQLRKTYQQDPAEHEDNVLRRFISPSLLILDEAHERRESDWENQMFTYLIDQRYQTASKQTIFIANQTAAQFESSVGSSIADRIQECGGIVECNWKSFRGGN